MNFRVAGNRVSLNGHGAVVETRFGKSKLQESSVARVGIELYREENHSVRLTWAAFSSELAPVETPPVLWAARLQVLCPEDAPRRQCKWGSCVGSPPRPDPIFARIPPNLHLK